MVKTEQGGLSKAVIDELAAQLANAKNPAEAKVIFNTFMTIQEEARLKAIAEGVGDELKQVIAHLQEIFPGIGGKYVIDLSTAEIVKLTVAHKIGKKGARSGTVNGKHYANATLACQDLGLEIGSDSAVRVLGEHNIAWIQDTI